MDNNADLLPIELFVTRINMTNNNSDPGQNVPC